MTNHPIKISVYKTDKGLKINLLMSREQLQTLLDETKDKGSCCYHRELTNSISGVAELRVETCHPDFKKSTYYYKDVVEMPDDSMIFVTTL